MAKNDQSQKGVDVNYHKRLAMGEKLDGTSLKGIVRSTFLSE